MEQIFNQAVGDLLSTRLSTPTSESYIYKGVKIIKDEDGIRILIKTMKNLKRYNMLVRYRDVVINRFVTTLELLKQ